MAGTRPVLEVFASGRLDRAPIETPADTDELLAELIVERDVGRRHLETVTASFTIGTGVASIVAASSTPRIIFGGRPQAFSTSMTPSVDSSTDSPSG